jgi:acetyl/propionyl-CoA carboxylase alpha subunit
VCRIYAEDPANDFFPSPGKIEFMKEPKGPGIRNDCGAYTGFEVPVDYDPIISKLVVHAQTRDQAIDKMVKALKEYIILGIRTPIDFLLDVLMSEPFLKGKVFTNFIETHFSDWEEKLTEKDIAAIAYVVDEFCNREIKAAPGAAKVTQTPFHTLGNWRL